MIFFKGKQRYGRIGRTKVFGIGFNKTGTTSLGVCLKTFGYKHVSCRLDLLQCVARQEVNTVLEVAGKYQSFEDWPWPLIYQELDAHFPGSKFILTTRKSTDTWLRSLIKHAERRGPREHRHIVYGHFMPHGHEEAHARMYEEHNRNVREYFRHREHDFLDVCWETGSGWKELCAFLGKKEPQLPFPHANKSPV